MRKGESLESHGGEGAEIIWTGHCNIDLTRHPRPETAQPILISAGALGRGIPWRDVVVSPDHAMYLRGHLIPTVKISSLQIAGEKIPLNRKYLTEGWRTPEPTGRWTTGHTIIPESLLVGAQKIRLTLAAAMRYPKPSARVAQTNR